MFWVVFGVDVVIAFTLLFFFLVGFADGSVVPADRPAWIALLVVVFGLAIAALTLFARERRRPAMTVAILLAVPGLLVVAQVLKAFLSGTGIW